jgi:polysaccharide chain length determinant protein (PEP-CTERM system associated)
MLNLINQLKVIIRGLWNYRWSGLITAAIIGLIGALLAAFWPNRYEATARVYVDAQSILQDALKGVAVQPSSAEQMAMVSRTLVSRPTLERVMLVAQLHLDTADIRGRERILDELTKEIEFKAVGNNVQNNLFVINYKHRKPETAKTVVQTLVNIFVEQSLAGGRIKAEQAERFLNDQIKDYESRLLQSENSLKEFKIKNMGLIPGEGGRDYVSRIQDLESQVRQARLEVRQAQNARDSVRRQLTGELPTLGSGDDSPALNVPIGPRIRTDIEERLEAAEKRLDDFRSRFTEEHPDVIATRKAVETLRGQREREKADIKAGVTNPSSPGRNPVANPVYRELRVQLSDAESLLASQSAKLADYEQRLTQARDSAGLVPKVEADLTQLSRDYETNRVNYQKLIQSREAVQISLKSSTSAGVGEIRIVDPPRVGQKPVSPNRFAMMIAALMASIAAGIGSAAARDQARPTFFDGRSLRSFTGVPLLGGVSFVTSAGGRGKTRRDLLAFSAGAASLLLAFVAAIVITGIRHFQL